MYGMRWGELALSYLRVLVWPAVVVSMLLVFRRQVGSMLSRFAERINSLKSFRAAGAVMEFSESLIEVQTELASQPAPTPEIDTEPPEFDPETVPNPPVTSAETIPSQDQVLAEIQTLRQSVDSTAFQDLLVNAPTAAIGFSWSQLDKLTEVMASDLISLPIMGSTAARVITLAEYFDNHNVFLIGLSRLRRMAISQQEIRNLAAHGESDFDAESANQFVRGTQIIVELLVRAFLKLRDEQARLSGGT